MRLEHAQLDAKGWLAGPWDGPLEVSVGYANEGVDEPHVHSRVTEIYLVANGTASLRIDETTIALRAGDVVIVEPGEAHTFLESSPDYRHFVVQTPGLSGGAARDEKRGVPRSRLGL
jgi:mannose-6-phosphate isomerase-like protein (cupin superfamily)